MLTKVESVSLSLRPHVCIAWVNKPILHSFVSSFLHSLQCFPSLLSIIRKHVFIKYATLLNGYYAVQIFIKTWPTLLLPTFASHDGRWSPLSIEDCKVLPGRSLLGSCLFDFSSALLSMLSWSIVFRAKGTGVELEGGWREWGGGTGAQLGPVGAREIYYVKNDVLLVSYPRRPSR